MWLSLVERLLWEQDAAGSNPVIRTKSPEFTYVKSGLFCSYGKLRFSASCEQSKEHALGQIAERRLWRMQQGDLCAAVEKIEDQRKPEDFIGHRKPAA